MKPNVQSIDRSCHPSDSLSDFAVSRIAHLPVCLVLFCLIIWSHQIPATASSNSLLYGMGNLTCTQSSYLGLGANLLTQIHAAMRVYSC